mmetsp:Transcript_6457/g.15122  ORF Transcript_6457/g.15122 Transcript_6457/m.15122 type:complete len:208 (+) Transcript_6457:413-1036(+)
MVDSPGRWDGMVRLRSDSARSESPSQASVDLLCDPLHHILLVSALLVKHRHLSVLDHEQRGDAAEGKELLELVGDGVLVAVHARHHHLGCSFQRPVPELRGHLVEGGLEGAAVRARGVVDLQEHWTLLALLHHLGLELLLRSLHDAQLLRTHLRARLPLVACSVLLRPLCQSRQRLVLDRDVHATLGAVLALPAASALALFGRRDLR